MSEKDNFVGGRVMKQREKSKMNAGIRIQVLCTVIFMAVLWIGLPVFAGVDDPPALTQKPWSGWWWPYAGGGRKNLYGEDGALHKYDTIVGAPRVESAQQFEWHGEAYGRWHGPGIHQQYTGNGDAWAIASMTYPEPGSSTTFGDTTLTTGEMKGLLCAASSMYDYEILSVRENPVLFWNHLRQNIGNFRNPLLFDTYCEVPGEWGVRNSAIYDYRAVYVSSDEQNYPDRHHVTLTVTYPNSNVDPDFMGTSPVTLTYTFDADIDPITDLPYGNGKWTGESRGYGFNRPDFIWFASNPHPWNPQLDPTLVEVIAGIGSIEMVQPSDETTLAAGHPSVPDPITVSFSLRSGGSFARGLRNKDAFEVTIGEKRAGLLNFTEDNDTYYLEVEPPPQASDGLYDMTLKFGNTEVLIQRGIRYIFRGRADVPLILDRSGSMNSSNYMEPAKSAAQMFVDMMEIGDMINVVSFASTATTNYPLTLIDSEVIKNEAKAAIGTISAGGATSISAGIMEARDNLVNAGMADHNWAMVLLSDGYHNTGTAVATALASLPDKVMIHTVALGPNSDQNMLNDIANYTGGNYYMAPTADDLNDVYAHISGDISGEFIVDIDTYDIYQDEVQFYSVNIDSTFYETTFYISWEGESEIDFTLMEPGGRIIDPDLAEQDLNITYTAESHSRKYKVRDPAYGNWVFTIEGTDIEPGGETYTVLARGKTMLRLNDYFDRPDYMLNEPILIRATLFDRTGPRTMADVHVDVYFNMAPVGTGRYREVDGDRVEIFESPDVATRARGSLKLYDDGKHHDGEARDGVYGNVYLEADSPGTYTFRIKGQGVMPSGEWFQRAAAHATTVSTDPFQILDIAPASLTLIGPRGGDAIETMFSMALNPGSPSPEKIHISTTPLMAPDTFTEFEGHIMFTPGHLEIAPGTVKTIRCSVYVPEGIEPDVYTGNVILYCDSGTRTVPITVDVRNGSAPLASIGADRYSGAMPLTVNFTGTGTSSDSTIASYSWDFNAFDGIQTDSVMKDPTHIFNAVPCPTEMVEPYYTTTLTVTDARGYTDTDRVMTRLLPDFGIQLEMNKRYYSPGDRCWLKVKLRNYHETMHNVAMIVFLDFGYGYYWFYPGWTAYPNEFDYLLLNELPLGITECVLFDRIWPEEINFQWDLPVFYGLLMDETLSEILTEDWAVWNLGFGPAKKSP